MDTIMNELSKFLLPLVASGVLAGLRFAAPALKEKVPSFLWPVAIFGLARVGAVACDAMDVVCNAKNPFDWSPETVNTMAAAFLAIVFHRIAKSVKSGDLVSKIKALLDKISGSANTAK